MPKRVLQSAALAAMLMIWPALAAGQIVDLLEEVLPPPDLETQGDRPVRLLGAFPVSGTGDVRSWTVSYARREPFTTRATDGLGLFAEQDRSLRLTVPLRRSGWLAGSSVVRSRATTSGWIDDRDSGPRLDGREDRFDAELWLGRGDTWRVRARFPVWTEGDDSPRSANGWAAAWTPSPEIGFAYAHSSLELQSRFHAPVIDDFIDFRLNADLTLDDLEIRIDPLPFLTVRVSQYIGEGEPAKPLLGIAADEMQLWGRMRGTKMKAVVEPSPGLEVAYAGSSWNIFAEGGLYWSGQRYGRLNVLSCDVVEHEMSLTWKARDRVSLRLVYASRDLSCFGRGRMESWPFTETAIDLLGVRQVAEAELDAAFERFSLGAGWTCDAGELAFGWAHHTIRPEGVLDTWIPGPLGIGRTDFVHRVVDAEKITIDEVRLAWRSAVDVVGVFLDIRQFVAASTELSHDNSPQDPDEPLPEDLPDMGWWGGLFMSAGLTVPF